MKYDVILESLLAAKESHLLWLDYGMSILNGTDLMHAQQPVSCTDCNFGLWYYSQANSLRSITGFKEIELLHADFHHKYDMLFTHAHEAHRPRLFGKKRLLEQLHQDYAALEKRSVLLIEKLTEMETRIRTKIITESHASLVH